MHTSIFLQKEEFKTKRYWIPTFLSFHEIIVITNKGIMPNFSKYDACRVDENRLSDALVDYTMYISFVNVVRLNII